MTKKSKKKPLDPTEAIKRLIIFALLKKGVKKGITSEEIGRVLDVDSSDIRRLVPTRKPKKSK